MSNTREKKKQGSPTCLSLVVVVVYVHITSVVQATANQKACKPGDVGLHRSQGIYPTPILSCSGTEPHKHDHNASKCDQAWKYLKNQRDAGLFQTRGRE